RRPSSRSSPPHSTAAPVTRASPRPRTPAGCRSAWRTAASVRSPPRSATRRGGRPAHPRAAKPSATTGRKAAGTRSAQEANMFGRPCCRLRARARQGGAVLLLACGLALPGCERTRPPAPEVQAQPGEEKPTRVLEEDLGLVRPGQKVRRRFRITNDSRARWTLARLHNDCACTAAWPLTKAVSPGDSMQVDVDYIARPSNLDERRRVGVEFAEAAAPVVWLEVRA